MTLQTNACYWIFRFAWLSLLWTYQDSNFVVSGRHMTQEASIAESRPNLTPLKNDYVLKVSRRGMLPSLLSERRDERDDITSTGTRTQHRSSIESSEVGNKDSVNSSSLIIKLNKKNLKLEKSKRLVNCSAFHQTPNKSALNVTGHCHSPNESLTCFQDPIFCEAHHLSGKRDLNWPIYGEYSFLPHEHWFKVLQHGGVVFLYQPCLHRTHIAQLRTLATQCLRRYVMTPYAYLSPEQPIALVTWGCYLLVSNVNFNISKQWMRQHAFKGPSSHVHKNGNYGTKLLSPSQVVTDLRDSLLCPDDREKAIFFPTAVPTKEEPILGEKLILHRLAKVQHKRTIISKRNHTLSKIDKGNAAWAFGSLVFLCALLCALVVYTKLWQDSRSSGYRCSTPYDMNELSISPVRRKFNFLKSSQAIISKIRRIKGKRVEKMSEMKLLTPIDEENEESSDGF